MIKINKSKKKIERKIIKQIINKITKKLRKKKIIKRTVQGIIEKNRNNISTTKVRNQEIIVIFVTN